MNRHSSPNILIRPGIALSSSPLSITQDQTLAAHNLTKGLHGSDDDALAQWVEDDWFNRQVHEAGAQTSIPAKGTK